MRGPRTLAGTAAVLVLTVVAASATIRLGADFPGAPIALARLVHRAAATLAAIAVALLLYLAPPALRAAARAAAALTVALALAGVASGGESPRALALFNQLGGPTLAALLAFAAFRASAPGFACEPRLARTGCALLVAQYTGAALLSAFAGPPLAVLAHATLGLAATLTLAAAFHAGHGRASARACGLFVTAAAPCAGVAAAASSGLAAAVLHATAAALTACAAGAALALAPRR